MIANNNYIKYNFNLIATQREALKLKELLKTITNFKELTVKNEIQINNVLDL